MKILCKVGHQLTRMVYEGSPADASLTESSLVHSASVKEEATNTINCPILGILKLCPR